MIVLSIEELILEDIEAFPQLEINNEKNWNVVRSRIKSLMIEFAKLHVQAALEFANKKAQLCLRRYNNNDFKQASFIELLYGQEVPTEKECEYWGISKDSILNAYPLENIK